MGDFNKVLSEEEKFGGSPICQRRVRAIQDCMNECHMMDLGFSGSKFTWSNKRDLGGLIQCKLDRCWANLDWKSFFPEANITHLARVNSDHYSLLLNLSPKLESFQLSRRIRQGDPITLYFFLLCMEFLGAQITKMCEDKRWDKVKASKNRPSFSHVFLRTTSCYLLRQMLRIVKPS